MSGLLPLIRVQGKGGYGAAAARIRSRARDVAAVEARAQAIVDRVRREGDGALFDLTLELDGADVGGGLRIGPEEVARALESVDPGLLQAMKFSLGRIRKTQGQLLRRLSYSFVSDGFVTRTVPRGLPSVGCYIPGGKAPLASTVLMTAGVARLAGVKRVVVCTPPDRSGRVDDAILAAAGLCGVDEVYRVGGAQSIAALAYGTESVPRVSKIVGPGGLYASVAKRLVSADVQIDFFAGPTEIVVVGDRSTDPETAAWDLIGQAEHGPDTLCGLVTWDAGLAERVRESAARISRDVERGEYVRGALAGGFAVVCADRRGAAEMVNALAPEHLELMMEDPEDFAARVENAGLVLSGRYAPCAASDYCVGTDHVIPTEGYAAARSSLSVLDFVKLGWVVSGTRGGLRGVLPSLKALANAEGLPNHYRSAQSRFAR
ncbi:MAG: histidinol dehydrogenase [Nitrososphaerales archaeon]|jgi:histidinol dehydrogenase